MDVMVSMVQQICFLSNLVFLITKEIQKKTPVWAHLPKQVWFLWFLWAAGKGKDLDHIWEGTAVGGLCDENGPSQNKDQEGDPEAHRRDDVTNLKTVILLDVSHTSQRQDSS